MDPLGYAFLTRTFLTRRESERLPAMAATPDAMSQPGMMPRRSLRDTSTHIPITCLPCRPFAYAPVNHGSTFHGLGVLVPQTTVRRDRKKRQSHDARGEADGGFGERRKGHSLPVAQRVSFELRGSSSEIAYMRAAQTWLHSVDAVVAQELDGGARMLHESFPRNASFAIKYNLGTLPAFGY